MSWELPSPPVCELIRRGAQLALDPPAEWLAELDQATLSGADRGRIAEDPVLAAAIRLTNRSNLLFWAAANVRAPGRRVPANLGDAPLAVARDLIRRGLNEPALDAYRVGSTLVPLIAPPIRSAPASGRSRYTPPPPPGGFGCTAVPWRSCLLA